MTIKTTASELVVGDYVVGRGAITALHRGKTHVFAIIDRQMNLLPLRKRLYVHLEDHGEEE